MAAVALAAACAAGAADARRDLTINAPPPETAPGADTQDTATDDKSTSAPATLDTFEKQQLEEFHALAAPFLSQYCCSCHDSVKHKGSLDLTEIPSLSGGERRRIYEKVAERVAGGKMPPRTAAQPGDNDRSLFISYINRLATATLPETAAPAGRVVTRRLNRDQFDRTVRDLTGISYDSTRTFPVDPAGHGFDSIGDVLSVSPLWIEKYFDAAREITDRFLADPASSNLYFAKTAHSNRAEMKASMARFMRRAFRRPPSGPEVATRMELFETAVEGGAAVEEGLRAAVMSILLSPHFLFRVEGYAGPRATTPSIILTDHEIATRLSYLLWSTMPDEEMDRLADAGMLHDPDVIRRQAVRMVRDTKSRALADGFGAQWFRYREILDRAVDFRRFPNFNDGVRRAMYEECALLMDSVVRENRSILELIESKETYVNETLAHYYHLPGVKGPAMRRITVPDRRRGGMPVSGAVLTVTSYPLRTSAVLRGKWILDEMLNDPPAPPPAIVPPLPQDDMQTKPMTPRARLEKHRADNACGACHHKIDPPGFALENYDAAGAWRDQFQDLPIDASTMMEDGTPISGPGGLKDYLLSKQDIFARAFSERLFTYATGRPPADADEALLRRIVDECARDGFRFETILLSIVTSRPFLYRDRRQVTEK